LGAGEREREIWREEWRDGRGFGMGGKEVQAP
jgi:hypothetical protein